MTLGRQKTHWSYKSAQLLLIREVILPTVCHCHPRNRQFASRWLKMVHLNEKHLISTSNQVGTRAFHQIDSSRNPPFNSILPVTKENCLCLICCSSTVLVRFGFNNGKQFLTCRLHEKLSMHATVQWKYVEHRTVCAVLYSMCSTVVPKVYVQYLQYCGTGWGCRMVEHEWTWSHFVLWAGQTLPELFDADCVKHLSLAEHNGQRKSGTPP